MSALQLKINDNCIETLTYTVSQSETQTTVTVNSIAGASADGLGQKYNHQVSGGIGNPSNPEATFTASVVQTQAGAREWQHTLSGNVFPITKTHSATTKTLGAIYKLTAVSDGTYRTVQKTVSISVPARTSYKVTFYANGGSGAPSQQTKWHGEPLTLTTAKPTRTGYDFVRWNTQAGGGGTNYSSGGTVAANTNGALNLYAIWSRKTYTITYDKNGGASGTTNSQTKTYGTPLTLRANGFTGQTNMGFDKWNTKADGTGTSYQAAQTDGYTANASATMYAIWKQIYASPRLTVKQAYRCDSGGSPDDEGTYLGVEAVYTLYDTGNNAVSSWTLSCNGQSTTTPASGGTGLSGDVKMVLAAGLSPSSRYTATLTLVDTAGGSDNKSTNTTTKTVSIGTTAYPINVHAGGDGVAIYGTSRRSGWLDVGNGFSAAFENNGRFDTTDTGHSFASASQSVDSEGHPTNEYGNSWYCYDSVGNRLGYAQMANTPTGTYRSFVVGNPRSGSAGNVGLYIYSNDDGTMDANLTAGCTWRADDIPNGMPAAKITSDSTSTIGNVITAASGWTITSVDAKRWGKICALTVQAKKNAAITLPVTGDIDNQFIGTLKDGYRPADYAPGMCWTYPGFSVAYPNGEFRWLTATPRSTAGSVAANTNIYFRIHYMLA